MVLDKKLKVLNTSSITHDRLIKKVILELKKYPKKDSEKFTYLKLHYIWKKTEFFGCSLVMIADVSEVEYYKKLAWIDELTGAYNRQAYKKLLFSTMSESIRNNNNLGLLFVDLDNLKHINTTKGYVGGDKAISQMSKIISDTLRPSDILIRYGGDEFLVIMDLRGNGDKSLMKVASRIVKNIREKTKPRNTASVGGVFLDVEQTNKLLYSKNFKTDWTDIVKKMDILVKKSKTSGKNQYFVSKYE